MLDVLYGAGSEAQLHTGPPRDEWGGYYFLFLLSCFFFFFNFTGARGRVGKWDGGGGLWGSASCLLVDTA